MSATANQAALEAQRTARRDKERSAAKAAKVKADKKEAAAKRKAEKERKARNRAALLEERGHTEESLKAQQDANRAKWEAKRAEAIAAGTYVDKKAEAAAAHLAAVKAEQFPDTMDELRALNTPLAEAAARHTMARLIEAWEFGTYARKPGSTSNPSAVVRTCLDLYQAQICKGLGIDKPRYEPDGNGGYTPTDSYVPPVLDDLSPECRQEALRVIAETRAEYEADGSPGLHERGLKDRMAFHVLRAVRATATA